MRVLLSWRRRGAGLLVTCAALSLASVGLAQDRAPVGQFPPGFLFGTASSAYQVEGGLHQTDWYQWETLCPKCSGDRADDGPAFLEHYQRDLGLARALLNNSIRIGIEWSRIFPTEASFPLSPDAAAVAQYHQVLRHARALGINVMVTLQHFTLPVYVQDLNDLTNRAGWRDPATVAKFARWAAFCAREFGAEVDWWVTINEPAVVANAGWVNGDMPPGLQLDVEGALSALGTMAFAHAAAFDAIKSFDTSDADGDGQASMVSVPHHMRAFHPMNAELGPATAYIRYLLNQLFLDAVTWGVLNGQHYDALTGRLDYIALQYYAPTVVVPAPFPGFPLPGVPMQSDLDRFGFIAPKTQFGWSIYPQGLREVLDELQPYGLPIVITENGIADSDDSQRPRYIADHLYVVAQAIQDGFDIRGYFHWSLTDNFELASGFCPRFGLFHVDYVNPAKPRQPGAGALAYRSIIAANTVPLTLFSMYPEYPAPATECPRQP